MFIALALLSSLSWAGPNALYGEDNRHEVFAETNGVIKTAALSTAALVSEDKMQEIPGGFRLAGRTLGNLYQMCSTERFRNQPVVATCSGTLVAPDIIMTAGHCYDRETDVCKNNKWIFDYRVSKDNQVEVIVPSSSVYNCLEVLHMENNMETGSDYALIRLDRGVHDRYPVSLQKKPSKLNDDLVLIGHPSGLPTKIADKGNVQKIFENHFISNLDAFTINSGSGVFNPKTGEAVGILASGRIDYESKTGCTKPIVYNIDEGNEAVFKIGKIIELLKKETRAQRSKDRSSRLRP